MRDLTEGHERARVGPYWRDIESQTSDDIIAFMKGRITSALLVLGALGISAGACTIFYATDGSAVMVGNNEDVDGAVPLKMWFVPAGNFGYGRVCFGWYSQAQGGMNDRGLFMDWAALPDSTPKPRPNGKPRPDGCMAERVLATCATVDEALRLFEGIAYEGNPAHFLVVDRTGESIVGEWLESGLKPIRRKDKQVITNFLLSDTPFNRDRCARYDTVQSMFGKKPEVSVPRFTAILKATAVSFSRGGGTKYSNVYDLTRGAVTLCVERDFAHPITINLTNELRRGLREVDLYALATNGLAELLPRQPGRTLQTLPTAQTVLDRFNKTRGSAAALANIHAFALSGATREGYSDDTGTFEFIAAPRRRADSFAFNKLGTYRDGYDGANAWQVQPTLGPIRVDGAIRDHARRDATFFNWRYGTADVMGPVKLVSFDGRDCFALSVRQSGLDALHYFDAETGLLAGIVTTTAIRSGATWSRTIYSAWAPFPNVLFPTEIHIQDEGYELKLRVDKVKINDLKGSEFRMPGSP